MKPITEFRILEIGQFWLLKRALPDQTTLIYTGEDLSSVQEMDYRIFDLRLLPWLRRSLVRSDWDLVFCHAPVRPLWDRRHGLTAALHGLLRRLVHLRTLGTYALHGQTCPVVMLDFNDEPGIPAHMFPLLNKAVACFKRELPADPAKAFLDAAPDLRTHRDVMSSRFVNRNLAKLRPISAAVADNTARLALATSASKEVDVFFAGSINSVIRAAGLPVLQSLQAQGYAVDFCEGGLSQDDYLARCARAWLTWSPEGYGWECFRHYEASLCLSVPVLNLPGILRHRPLLDGVHAVYYPVEGDGLRDAIVRALADKPQLAVMAQAARAHALRYHTHSAVAAHMLDVARAALEGRPGGDVAP
jgi:hypothetical protein